MDETTRHLVSGIVAFIVVSLLMGRLIASGHADPKEKAGWRIIGFSKSTEICMWVTSIFFAAIAILASNFPGRTRPQDLPWAIGCFAFFAILGAFTAWLLPRAEVRFNKSTLSGANFWGKRQEISWDKITKVEFVQGLGGYKITSEGSSIWLYPTMHGFTSILPRLNKELERLGLPPIETNP